jgi:hypothetical protein
MFPSRPLKRKLIFSHDMLDKPHICEELDIAIKNSDIKRIHMQLDLLVEKDFKYLEDYLKGISEFNIFRFILIQDIELFKKVDHIDNNLIKRYHKLIITTVTPEFYLQLFCEIIKDVTNIKYCVDDIVNSPIPKIQIRKILSLLLDNNLITLHDFMTKLCTNLITHYTNTNREKDFKIACETMLHFNFHYSCSLDTLILIVDDVFENNNNFEMSQNSSNHEGSTLYENIINYFNMFSKEALKKMYNETRAITIIKRFWLNCWWSSSHSFYKIKRLEEYYEMFEPDTSDKLDEYGTLIKQRATLPAGRKRFNNLKQLMTLVKGKFDII